MQKYCHLSWLVSPVYPFAVSVYVWPLSASNLECKFAADSAVGFKIAINLSGG